MVILMVLVKRTEERTEHVVPSFFFCPQVRRWHLQQTLPKVPLVGDNFHFINAIAQFYKCDSSVNDCKFRSYHVIFATLQQINSLMNEFLSYIIINEINFAAQQSPTCPIDNNSFRMLHI